MFTNLLWFLWEDILASSTLFVGDMPFPLAGNIFGQTKFVIKQIQEYKLQNLLEYFYKNLKFIMELL
jgi:hypothetical protein